MPSATLGSRESGVGREFGDVYNGITPSLLYFPPSDPSPALYV